MTAFTRGCPATSGARPDGAAESLVLLTPFFAGSFDAAALVVRALVAVRPGLAVMVLAVETVVAADDRAVAFAVLDMAGRAASTHAR